MTGKREFKNEVSLPFVQERMVVMNPVLISEVGKVLKEHPTGIADFFSEC